MEALSEIISDFFNSIGQTEKYSQRAHVFRVAPDNGHSCALEEYTPTRTPPSRPRASAHSRAGDAANQNYCRKSSSFSVLRWAAMAALLIFGFSERDCSNA